MLYPFRTTSLTSTNVETTSLTSTNVEAIPFEAMSAETTVPRTSSATGGVSCPGQSPDSARGTHHVVCSYSTTAQPTNGNNPYTEL